MAYRKNSVISKTAGLLAILSLAAPLGATVRDGVDAWSRGDYAAAVAEWQGPAAQGDPDALFNMGQAYRLGRGVPQNTEQAERLYLAAAQAGHVQAADTYGLMLFQDGRRAEALPYVQAASRRGDPRAQYLIGIAHFNGDLVERDWERAYALLSLANGAGLPQAGPAIQQMDTHIPIEQRQAAVALSRQIELEAEQARSVQLTAADLSAPDTVLSQQGISAQERSAPQRPIAQAPAAAQGGSGSVQSVAVSPSVAAARDAVAQAREATGTADPAQAGASYARGAAAAPAPVEVAAAPTPSAQPTNAQSASPQAVTETDGPWRVQLGAFGVPGNAERLWDRLSTRPELAGRERLLLPTGRVTRLQAAGFATRAQAQSACSALRRAGQECLVTRN